LKRSTGDPDALLLPSLDTHRVCRDPDNRTKILRRFFGTVAYAMIILATNTLDVYHAMRDDGTVGPRVMSASEFTFQSRCLSETLDQIKGSLLAGQDIPKGSVIALAGKVLEEALRYMDEATDGLEELATAAKWIMPYEGERFYFWDRLKALRMEKFKGKRSLWSQKKYKTVLAVSRGIDKVLQSLYVRADKLGASPPSDAAIRRALMATSRKE
jgi:hypothetical protein